jgi:hypothetical protein
MTEKAVEAKLVKGVKDMGGLAYKFVSPGNIGVPDRLLIFPDGTIWFVELKADNGRLSVMQEHQIERLAKCNARVALLTGAKEVEHFLQDRREAQQRAIEHKFLNSWTRLNHEV